MHAEPADKFHCLQLHGFYYSSVPVIFVGKIYLTIIVFLQAVIADGYFMGIAAQVFYYTVWAVKRFFGKHYPWLFVKAVQQAGGNMQG